MPAATWEREERRPGASGARGWRELSEICAALHASRSGTSDRMSDAEVAYDLETLRVALREWTGPWSPYDEAQRGLAVATLLEYGAGTGA